MAIEIGRLHAFGVGIEATAGTSVAAQAYIPLETGKLKPSVTLVKDESGIGNIASISDAHVTKTMSEFEGKGIIRPTSIGYLLLGTLGQVAAPTTIETGVYSHAFTIKNNNSHPALTIVHDNQTEEEKSAYQMIDSFEVQGDVGEYARFSVKATGRTQVSATGLTPAFATSGDSPFKVSKASVKFAANIAGLAAASKIGVQSFKFTFEKNLEQIWSTMTGATAATDFASQHNKNISIKGDFELIFDSTTYKALAIAGTKQAIEITLEGESIGATSAEKLTFQFASVTLEDWDIGDDKDGIITQTFGFEALYKTSEALMATATLVNTKATQYAAA